MPIDAIAACLRASGEVRIALGLRTSGRRIQTASVHRAIVEQGGLRDFQCEECEESKPASDHGDGGCDPLERSKRHLALRCSSPTTRHAERLDTVTISLTGTGVALPGDRPAALMSRRQLHVSPRNRKRT